MKAIVCTAYGLLEVPQFQEVDKPLPRANEVLIQVRATTVHRGDSRMRGLDIPDPAHRYVDQGHKKGNVVITVTHQGQAR